MLKASRCLAGVLWVGQGEGYAVVDQRTSFSRTLAVDSADGHACQPIGHTEDLFRKGSYQIIIQTTYLDERCISRVFTSSNHVISYKTIPVLKASDLAVLNDGLTEINGSRHDNFILLKACCQRRMQFSA